MRTHHHRPQTRIEAGHPQRRMTLMHQVGIQPHRRPPRQQHPLPRIYPLRQAQPRQILRRNNAIATHQRDRNLLIGQAFRRLVMAQRQLNRSIDHGNLCQKLTPLCRLLRRALFPLIFYYSKDTLCLAHKAATEG